jgi:glycosyltransferase involved in cell wall biosynthesis
VKIAYFSPLPPARTGIADYSKDLMPALMNLANVDLWVDQPVSAAELPHCKTFNYLKRPDLSRALNEYDFAIYHMGNSPAHRNIYPILLAHPGIVVLHDFVLHHFLAGYYLEALQSPALYVEEMAYNYGATGEELAKNALADKRLIWEHEQSAARYPLNKRILDNALGVIVHSDFASRLVLGSHPHLPVARINLPVRIWPEQVDQEELRKRYRIPADHLVIASFGSDSPAKRTEIMMRVVRGLGRKDIVYLLVGEMGQRLRGQLKRAGIGDLARITGHVNRETFNDYCNLIDLGIDLRYPTMGESSAGVCRILGAGKACVVSNLGWYAELPDDCVVKVDPAAEEETLVRRLSVVLDDGPLRRDMGANARRYIAEHHTPEAAAQGYI